MAVNIRFGDYQFNGIGKEVFDWTDKCNTRISTVIIPRKEGRLSEEGKLDNRIISIRGTLSGRTKEDVKFQEDALKEAVMRGKKKLALFDERYLIAQKKNFSISYVEGSGMRVMKYAITFQADTPFWYSAREYTHAQEILTSPYSWELKNGGNAYSYPVVQVHALAGDIHDGIQIENKTDRTFIKYRGIVLSETTLTIDIEKGVVKNNGVADLANFEGDLLGFILQAGTNRLQFTGSNCTVQFIYRYRWL